MPGHVRARGVLRAEFARAGAVTGLARLYEEGGLRLRCPRIGGGCEAVTINTGGGWAGGDAAHCEFSLGLAAAVTITSQSAEKIYRSDGPPARLEMALRLAGGASAELLPQETILFDKARLDRHLTIDLAADARLLLLDCTVFGRLAMGEEAITGQLRDRWQVRRAGELVLAKALRLDGNVRALLDRPALGRGARAIASLLMVAPDAEAKLDDVRAILAEAPVAAGASAWNGMLLARLATHSPEAMRAVILRLLTALRGRGAPRVWQ